MSILSDIQTRLASVRNLLLRAEFRRLFFLFIALTIVLTGILLLSEATFRFDSTFRTAVFYLFSAFIVTGAWLLLRSLLRLAGFLAAPPESQLAILVGAKFPQVRDRLLNLLQLQQERARGTLYSEDLIDASFHDLAETIAPLDFTHAVDVSRTRKAAKLAGMSAIGVILLFLMAPRTLSDAAFRLLAFDRDFLPPAEYSLEVFPGHTETVKGESVEVTVRVRSAASPHIPSLPLMLFWKPEAQEDFEVQQVRGDSTAIFRTTLAGLRTSTEYYAEFSCTQSERYTITVIDKPLIRSSQVRLDFPPYTGLATRILDEFVGDVTALKGTVVRFEGTASKELDRAHVLFNSTTQHPLNIQGNRFFGRATLTADSQYQIILTDRDGLQNPDPILHSFHVLPDEYPRVSIVQPGKNVDIAGTSSLPLLIQMSDDFGFSALRLRYRLIHSRYERPSDDYTSSPIPLRGGAAQAEILHTWDFSSLGLVPEDVVEYFAEVYDNDVVSGPKRTHSETFLLRLPSLEEVFTDLDAGHEETLQDLRESVEQANDLKEKIESINEDFKKNKDLDWQQQKTMEETARKFQDLQKKLDDVQNRLETMTQQMQEQNVLSTETLEKYLELQQLFEQLNSEELRQAMQSMQDALRSVNKDKLRQALEQITFSEERFRQSIERTLDLLKRIQIEQKLDEARKRAEELTELQKELDQSTEAAAQGDSTSLTELARKQDDLRKKLEALREAARDVQNRMEEFFTEMPEEELQAALEQLDSMKTADSMKKAAQQMRASQLAQARQTQEQVQRGLQQLSMDLSQVQMQMLQQQQQHVVNELRRATHNLLELSQREEQLKQQSAGAPSGSPQLRENAQNQMRALQDLSNVVSSLSELAKKSFAVTPGMGRALGEAMIRMQNALKALDTRSGDLATQEQGKAMESLNKAAMEVQQSLQDLQQQGGGGAGGLMGQLQQMAGRQMSINMRTQGMEDAARLAAEQRALQKSLEQLNAEARAAGEQDRILGDLKRIAEEMEEVVKNLEQRNVNPETIRRQEQILSRLLDASRSTREQDFEKRRRAQTGRQIARPSPDELDPNSLQGRNKLRDDLLKALEHGYSKDYQELIRRYFEQLQKVEGR